MNRRSLALLATLAAIAPAIALPAHAASEVPFRRNVAVTAPLLFAALDTDRDGVISVAEQANAPIALRALDTNDDGIISPEEMAGPVRPGALRRLGSASPAPVAFRSVADLNLLVQLDANHDGVIQPLELANAASSLRLLDINLDGVLDRDEVLSVEVRLAE